MRARKSPIRYTVKRRKDAPKGPFYVHWTVNGRGQRRSTGLYDAFEAKALEDRLNTEEVERSIFGRASVETRVTFAYAALQYIEAAETPAERAARNRFLRIPEPGDEPHPKSVFQALGDDQLADIDDDLMRRRARETYPDALPATRRRQFYVPALAVLKWSSCRPRSWCPSPDDIKKPPDSDPRVDFLLPQHGDALARATTTPYARAIAELIIGAGFREAELARLLWRDVSLATGEAWIRKAKMNKPRRVEFGQRARAALANLPHREGAVARNQYGRPYTVKNNTGGLFNAMLAGAAGRAGLDRTWTAHELRITWATWHYAHGKRADVTADLGGWRGKNGEISQTLWRYVKAAPRNIDGQLAEYGFDFSIEAAGAGDAVANS